MICCFQVTKIFYSKKLYYQCVFCKEHCNLGSLAYFALVTPTRTTAPCSFMVSSSLPLPTFTGSGSSRTRSRLLTTCLGDPISLAIVDVCGDFKTCFIKLEMRTTFASLSRSVGEVLQVGLICASQCSRPESPPALSKVGGFLSHKTSPAKVTTLLSSHEKSGPLLLG